MLDIMILEDESYTLRFLEKLIGDHPCASRVRAFSSSRDLRLALDLASPDIIFLDIELAPDEAVNGIDLAKEIYSMNKDILMVFITGYAGYALESFNVHPFDYLLKPINKEKLHRIIAEADERKENMKQKKAAVSTPAKTVVKTGDGLAFVDWQDVYFIEKQGRCVLIHTRQGICKTRCVLSDLEPILPEQFIQAHKSFIINRDMIYRLKDVGNQSYEVSFYSYERIALMSRAKFREYHNVFSPSL